MTTTYLYGVVTAAVLTLIYLVGCWLAESCE